MFEITVVPVWAFVVTMIVCLGGIGGALVLGTTIPYIKKNENEFSGCGFFLGILIMVGGFVLLGSGAMNQHSTVDNPLSSDAHR